MNYQLHGWELTEGRINMAVTRNPNVSVIIAAMESLRPDVKHPFVILAAPAEGDDDPNYCQVFSGEKGYVCEIRIFRGTGFCHMRAFLRDADGCLGDELDPLLPDLGQAVRIFTGFIADPNSFPSVDTMEWLDVSEDFEPVG